jgi:hypothetical protein
MPALSSPRGDLSFNDPPGSMNVHFAVKAAAVDIANEAK